jgi:hypothetical protein
MNAQTGSRGIAFLFFNHGARWSWMINIHAPAALPPRKRPVTHYTGGWVEPRAGPDGCEKPRPRGEMNDTK